ncbi:hypothetical protein C5B42_04790 [Candidatus Cerribacteria bacterium 'Amazon FNV 2010 28 9']|uniref:Uncharacterized protein n=1 Tax=Candidatus Cerribacteria bacterium 'Amazon FNV 2010 28 9' TaxID=2081795 RepID=A0A317JNU7_9BACT|nr:MAG: hypothetical protein C5B42_04790 [Candidatus Cerribacteria bacterium 'Amazon FNV 2010 28 9']
MTLYLIMLGLFTLLMISWVIGVLRLFVSLFIHQLELEQERFRDISVMTLIIFVVDVLILLPITVSLQPK